MILVWKDNVVQGYYSNTQMEDIRPLYTSHQFLRAPDDTIFVVIHHSDPQPDEPGFQPPPDEDGNLPPFVPPVSVPNVEWDEQTMELEEIQPASFAADTLLGWNGVAWVLSGANQTEQNKRTTRRPNALTDLKNPALRDMILAGRTKIDADAWIAAQANTNDALAQVVMLVSRLARFTIHQENDFFAGE